MFAVRRRCLSFSLGALLALNLLGACTTDGETPSPTAAPAANPEPAPFPFEDYGEPLSPTAGAWSFTEFSNSHCGDGSPAGVGVNASPTGSTNVLLYLEGGGLCWDAFTCGQGLATFIDGLPNVDSTLNSPYGRSGIFDRDNADNPFRNDQFVYVPYCTGDLHGGSAGSTPHNVAHVGARNMTAYLQRVVPTFPDATRVTLAGSSAGGFGALLNFEQVQTAFREVPVTVLMDSAPPLGTDTISQDYQNVWRNAWNYDAMTPSDCTTCNNLGGMFTYLINKYPDHRFGIVDSVQDATLRQFVGLGMSPPGVLAAQDWTDGINTLLTSMTGVPNVRLFLLSGSGHVFTNTNPLGAVRTNNIPYTDWIRGLLGESETWDNVFP